MRNLKTTMIVATFLLSLLPMQMASGFAPTPDLNEEELNQLFGVFDANANGVITKEELRAVIASFRVEIVDAEIDKMFVSYDLDEDGYLQRSEFTGLMSGFGEGEDDVTRQMEQTFLRYDANRDGGLDAREVKTLMEAGGEMISLREAKRIVFEADDDGNGRIDTAEFNKTAG